MSKYWLFLIFVLWLLGCNVGFKKNISEDVLEGWKDTPFSIMGKKRVINDSIVTYKYNMSVMGEIKKDSFRIKIFQGEVFMFDSCLFYTYAKTPFVATPLFDFKQSEKDSTDVICYFEDAYPPPFNFFRRSRLSVQLVKKVYDDTQKDWIYCFDIRKLRLPPFYMDRLLVFVSYSAGVKGVIFMSEGEIVTKEGYVLGLTQN